MMLSVLFAAVSCSPMEDINDELESEYTGPVADGLAYELTPADYKTISGLAQEDALTVDEYNLATQVAVDTVLYGDMAAVYAPEILNNEETLLGYGVGSTLTLTYRYAEAIGDTIVESSQLMKVDASSDWATPAVIEFNLAQSDYQYITDYVKNSDELSQYWESKYGGREIYYGTSPSYSNFDMRYATRCYDQYGDKEGTIDPKIAELYEEGLLSGDYTELDAFLDERAFEAMMMMMENKYASGGATIESNGDVLIYKARALFFKEGYVDQYVVVSYECTKASPNPTFKQVEVTYE